jgi:hypothetical protein
MLAKAPNRKRATAYLEASGAGAISIIDRDCVCIIRAGSKITDLRKPDKFARRNGGSTNKMPRA